MQKEWHMATKPLTGYVYGRVEIYFFVFGLAQKFSQMSTSAFLQKIVTKM